MKPDLSKLSDSDLDALIKGDISKVSDAGLAILSGKTSMMDVGATAPLGVKAAMTAMQGPTFGFADELMGLITAPEIGRAHV